jgi:hypothetical protein
MACYGCYDVTGVTGVTGFGVAHGVVVASVQAFSGVKERAKNYS